MCENVAAKKGLIGTLATLLEKMLSCFYSKTAIDCISLRMIQLSGKSLRESNCAVNGAIVHKNS